MDFLENENQGPKRERNCAQIAWICGFSIFTHIRVLLLTTHWICGLFDADLSCVIALVAQNDMDMWIFENMKINVLRVKVTVRKMLWIFGFSISTHLRVLLV